MITLRQREKLFINNVSAPKATHFICCLYSRKANANCSKCKLDNNNCNSCNFVIDLR